MGSRLGGEKMTAQVPETIWIENESHFLCTEPLEAYRILGGKLPSFDCRANSAIQRGYLGTWEIINERLYLTELEALLESGQIVDLGALFPEFATRVFAHWYSGTLRIPQGKEIEYIHAGYCSEFERDLLIEVEKGVVRGMSVRHNGEAPEDAPDSYRVLASWVR